MLGGVTHKLWLKLESGITTVVSHGGRNDFTSFVLCLLCFGVESNDCLSSEATTWSYLRLGGSVYLEGMSLSFYA